MPKDLELSKEAALTFRDQLREARLKALADAEAFEEVVFVVERLGCYLRKKQGDLGKYEPYIVGLASRSPLSHAAPDSFRSLHIPVPALYDLVRQARNDMMHTGAAARYATRHAVELALVLEDALMNSYNKNAHGKVADFMVRNPICAAMWHPLSFIRQTMLTNSFSCLPVNAGTDGKPTWRLVSDKELVKYLRLRSCDVPLKDLLVETLDETTKREGVKLNLFSAQTYPQTAEVGAVLAGQNGKGWDGEPVLVTQEKGGDLLGILTPYDLL